MKRILLLMMLVAPLMAGAQQVDKLQKKVASGDVKAMFELADCYQAGYGVPVDSAKALELYRKADALGAAEAKAHLARFALYYGPMGHDSAECYRLSKAAADGGSAYGVYRLAICYLDGIVVKRDYNQAHALLEKAMKMGCQEAFALVGRGYLIGQYGYAHDIEKGYQYLKKSPEGCCSGKYGLMAQYFLLKGDRKTAVKWLEKGKAVGSPMAIAEYARYMENGWGMPVDERGALSEYRRLKEKYLGDATYKMLEANLLANAKDSTLRDSKRALQLYEEIGDEPYASNYDAIAVSYIYGLFTPVDSNMAYRYWLRGARKKDVYSMINLARYHAGQYNNDSAVYYLEMACEQESEEAASMLASHYYDDDRALSMRYAQQAADWGDEQARVGLGQMYLDNGDYAKAMECYDKAIANAYYDAYIYKAELSMMNGGEKSYLKLLEEGGKKGSTRCYGVLGQYYDNNEDYKKAIKYYELAGDPQSDFQLARIYLGGAIDTSEATKTKGQALLRRSAYAGNHDGMYWLGYYYQQEQNFDSALYYFNSLAEQGDGMSLMQMAIAYEHGRGVNPDTVLAMDYYHRAGEAGISDGYAYLGDFYRYGTSTIPPDSAKAYEYYLLSTAIEVDNAAGLYYVGDSYLRGIGVSKDTAAALPYFQQAAAKGSYRSMGVIGDYFNYGWPGMTMDGDSALYYYFEASKGDDPRGDYMIGMWLFDQKAYDKGLEYIVSAASNGNPDAYVTYAFAMLVGAGMEADPAQGYALLEQLAPNNEDGRAYNLLGLARLAGVGCEVDTAMAVRYLDSAADFGNAEAMMTLGGFYAMGSGVERDTVKTLEYYNRAVATGSTKAMLRLAGSHQSGEMVPLDKKRAAELYQMAADRGNLEAMCRLGLCYEEGEGVILNSRKAYNLYTQAAENGSAFGMYLLGMCYIEGVYVKEDTEQAAQWFLKGAEAGSVRCCYIIGQMYATGDGVKKNKKEAKKWLTLAAENGIEAAEQMLREL